MTYVFDIQKCDIEAILPVSPETWLPDINIPDWPEDVRACVPRPPPILDPDVPCVMLYAGPTNPGMGMPSVAMEAGEMVPLAGRQMALSVTPEAGCTYKIEIDPKWPCPQFPSGTTEISGTFVHPALAFIELGITPFQSAQQCGFQLGFDGDFPCPVFPFGQITFEGSGSQLGAQLDITAEDEGDLCGFNVSARIWGGFQGEAQAVQSAGCQFGLAWEGEDPATLTLRYPAMEEVEVVTGWQVSGVEIQVRTATIMACVVNQGDWTTAHTGTQCQT